MIFILLKIKGSAGLRAKEILRKIKLWGGEVGLLSRLLYLTRRIEPNILKPDSYENSILGQRP